MTTKRKPLLLLRYQILERDNFTCQICGKHPPNIRLEVDHIIPIAEGGTDDPDNLRASCMECNRGMGILTLQNTIAKKKQPPLSSRENQIDNILLKFLKGWHRWEERSLLEIIKNASKEEHKESLHRLWKRGLIKKVGDYFDGYEWIYIDPYLTQYKGGK